MASHFSNLATQLLMFKLIVVCCAFLACFASLAAPAQAPVTERVAPEHRKALRATVAAQQNASAQQEQRAPSQRQLTPRERAQLRQQMRQQMLQQDQPPRPLREGQ
jgi:DMSO/TMAO reductase YedYZ molybdopterin-dependent catalytic subunit